MKTLTAAAVAFGLAFAAAPVSAKTVFERLAETAPRATDVFVKDTAPRTVFERIRDTAPRSDGVFGRLNDSAPRSDGVFGRLENQAP